MPFEKINFILEFPKEEDCKKIKESIDFDTEIWVACHSIEEYNYWNKKLKSKYIRLRAWPILKIEDGYWFSGSTSIENINKLKQFKNIPLKIDLETPIVKPGKFNIIRYLIKIFFNRAKKENYTRLKKTITYFSQSNKNIIVNSFPLPSFFLKWKGLFYLNKDLTQNYMAYTSFLGPILKPILKLYLTIFLKHKLKKEKNISCSIGLIGKGILKDEKSYKSINQFKRDLKTYEKIGIKSITIYSIESLLKRKNPEQWINLLKMFKSTDKS